MILTEEEREAKDGKQILLAVNHAGVSNLCGPIVSIGVALDYTAISERIVEAVVDRQIFTKDEFNEIKSAIKAFGFYTIPASKLNEIRSLEIATHMADYNALMGLIFEVFKVYSEDPDTVQVKIPIREVIKNKELSIYQNRSNNTSYIMRSEWTQFDNLIPNTQMMVMDQDTFSLLFAKAFANTVVHNELEKAAAKYKGYDFISPAISEEQAKFLTENGMTEFHRAFLPEFSGFAFSKRILI